MWSIQYDPDSCREQMSLRKPLVRFESSSRAQLVPYPTSGSKRAPSPPSPSADEESEGEREKTPRSAVTPSLFGLRGGGRPFRRSSSRRRRRSAKGSASKRRLTADKKGERNIGSSNPTKKHLVVAKGRVSLKVPGYQGKQKVHLSKLVHHLPVRELQRAARKVLLASRGKGGKKKKSKALASSRSLPPATAIFDYG